MTLSSTRGLARVAVNPSCDLQTAMVVEGVREPEFYRRVTGTDYPGEYGERDSARRRGAKFESQLHANDCASLREILAVTYGLDPVAMTVRNFADEVPARPPRCAPCGWSAAAGSCVTSRPAGPCPIC